MLFRLIVPLLALLLIGEEVKGSIRYFRTCLEVDGRKVLWKDITSITEAEADRMNLGLELIRRRFGMMTAASHTEVGVWCRSVGLEEEAKESFTKAIEIDPNHQPARGGLGLAKTDKGWVPARDLYPDKKKDWFPRKAGALALADWCRDHSLFAEEFDHLSQMIIVDGFNKPVITRIKVIQDAKVAKTLLAPPLEGRWLALDDLTRHHQGKAWATTAVDFVKMDDKGRTFKNEGKALEDYFAFDMPVYAAAYGVVSEALGDFEDLPPGKGGGMDEANTVSIRHTDKETTHYGHLKKGSLAVKGGDTVKKGQLIGRVGNSGASGKPHLHFAMVTPVYNTEGKGMWLGLPWRLEAFTIVKADITACSIKARNVRPQEGWVMEFSR